MRVVSFGQVENIDEITAVFISAAGLCHDGFPAGKPPGPKLPGPVPGGGRQLRGVDPAQARAQIQPYVKPASTVNSKVSPSTAQIIARRPRVSALTVGFRSAQQRAVL